MILNRDSFFLENKDEILLKTSEMPGFIYEVLDELFFGQDRFHHLISALEQDGLIYK